MKIDPYLLVDDLLKSGYTIEKEATGTSMLPSLRPHSLLRVHPLSEKSIGYGDVVLFKTESGKVLLHRVSRIVKKDDITYFQTWGDNNFHPDEITPEQNILGRVTAFRHADGDWKSCSSGITAYLRLLTVKYLAFYCRRAVSRLKQRFWVKR